MYPQLLLRFSKEEYLKNSLNNGIFRLSPFSYYRELEEQDIIKYKEYNKLNIEPPKDLKFVKGKLSSIKIDNKIQDINLEVTLKEFHKDDKILCFYNGLNHADKNLEEKNIKTYSFTYNEEMNSFPSRFCLVIYNTDEFHNRILNTKKVKSFDYVKYIENFEPNLDYSPFIKHKIYSFQNEFRYIFDDDINEIKIGSIADIAKVVNIEELNNIEISLKI
ncbi:hypothetical protein SAMN05421738_10169 [Algoriella xinjiangensis]|uniref:Uncharacterized protein n=1 Tax=Algoriella xinjiangensis TaxID=684065 RepID=A0A1I4S6D5_9FLAO|nr:DUF2971 domain-containing protein [Algoriella xinjiangensis]SFM59931.1 hypothetical protein SAMN05421738_10169 [Algoriella xinjiangensis]VDH15917.1 Uncharacterised protein [Algoriella xinjiangensis]